MGCAASKDPVLPNRPGVVAEQTISDNASAEPIPALGPARASRTPVAVSKSAALYAAPTNEIKSVQPSAADKPLTVDTAMSARRVAVSTGDATQPVAAPVVAPVPAPASLAKSAALVKTPSVTKAATQPPVRAESASTPVPSEAPEVVEPRRRVSLKDPQRRGSEAYHTAGRIADSYSVGKAIGKGGFGEVRLGTRIADGKR
jgi:hypothetical protein